MPRDRGALGLAGAPAASAKAARALRVRNLRRFGGSWLFARAAGHRVGHAGPPIAGSVASTVLAALTLSPIETADCAANGR